MARLSDRLAAHSLMAFDTSVFIYHLENHPRYCSLTNVVLQGVQGGQWAAVASMLVIMELTVQPWRLERPEVAREYEARLVHFPNLTLIEVGRDVARTAARLRGAHNLRPADALHAATALVAGATALVSNDRGFLRLSPLLDVVLLNDFVYESGDE